MYSGNLSGTSPRRRRDVAATAEDVTETRKTSRRRRRD